MLTIPDVMERTGWGRSSAARICRLYGVQPGGKEKSRWYIHRDILDLYEKKPWMLTPNPNVGRDQVVRTKRNRGR